ncbi:MAG: hypothetical protein ACRDHZ_01325 [Ktedonobacteraceae bacterium]
MKDKDQQNDEFEQKVAATRLLLIKEGINADVDQLREIADQHIQRGTGGREVALAITHLQQARQWVEEALRELEI